MSDALPAPAHGPRPRLGPASPGEARQIAALTARLAPQTVPISSAAVGAQIGNYLVARAAPADGGHILGCVGVHRAGPRRVELRSLAVAREARGMGLGKRLVRAAVRRAHESGRQLVCVSLQPEFFECLGFTRVPLRALPGTGRRPRFIDGRERVALVHLGTGLLPAPWTPAVQQPLRATGN